MSKDLKNVWQAPVKVSNEKRTAQHAEMRSKCPIGFMKNLLNNSTVWTLFRSADIAQAVRDTGTFSNAQRVRLAARRIPLESDPPEHTLLRKLLMPFFSPKYMLQFEAVTREITRDIMGSFIRNGGGDFAREVARALPTQVLLARLGQPRQDWEDIKNWSEATLPGDFKNDAHARSFQAADAALWTYSRQVVEDRKRCPRNPQSDIVSALLHARPDGAAIEDDLIVGCVRLMVAAGHDSTSQALGICVHYLAVHTDLQTTLRAEPALIRKAIEEILRLESPVVAMPRIVAKDVELHGCPMKAGDRLMLNWASANRDPDAFDDPDAFRLDRGPVTHMVFGDGIHSCLGAPMARQELRLVLEMLLSATSHFDIAGATELMDMHHFGFDALPLRLLIAPSSAAA
ncbi:MAG: cytochrome P450 [Pseudomonadota bacterium]